MTEERVYLWNRTRGKTDEEIYEVVSSLGRPATFLELIMAILPQELDPAEAKDCVIGFEISADERLDRYRVEVRDGQLNVERRDPAGADATIAVALADFVRLITEEVSCVKEIMVGKIWVCGESDIV